VNVFRNQMASLGAPFPRHHELTALCQSPHTLLTQRDGLSISALELTALFESRHSENHIVLPSQKWVGKFVEEGSILCNVIGWENRPRRSPVSMQLCAERSSQVVFDFRRALTKAHEGHLPHLCGSV